MAKITERSLVASATPKDLFEKYKDKLTQPQFVYVNLVVLHDMRRADALQTAFPKTAKWSRTARAMRADNLLSKYLNPFVRQYYDDLVALYEAEFREQANWSKEKSVRELVDIIQQVKEEEKPYYSNVVGDYIKPTISKSRMDAKLQAIAELNKLSGFTNNSKLDITSKQVIFTGEKEIKDDD